MGSCQIQRTESESNSCKESSSKCINSKSSIIANQIVQSSNAQNKLELDQIIEDEDNLHTVQSRIKKNKRLYNFQEEESHRKISNADDVESIKLGAKQKRRLFRTSVTHSHFDEIRQNSPALNQSLQAERDDDAKSVKSILKKNSKLKDSLSGSPETRSVRFARGTIFRTKSQRSLRQPKNKKHNRPDTRPNESMNSFEIRSPNWKRHREQERVYNKYQYDLTINNQYSSSICYESKYRSQNQTFPLLLRNLHPLSILITINEYQIVLFQLNTQIK